MRISLCLLNCTLLGLAQVALAEGEFRIIDRGPHHQTWQREVLKPGPGGRTITNYSSYVELATGQWQPAREEWQILPDGVVARSGRHQVILARNINLGGAVDVLTPDGVRLVSNPVGLGFFDPVDGKRLVIAEVRDAAPARGAPNEIIFPDCFDKVRASIRYTYRRAGLAQDLLLEQKLALPEGFSEKSRLELYTEFHPATPQPKLTPHVLRQETDPLVRAAMVEPDWVDSSLDFGEMKVGLGKAFSLGKPTTGRRLPVAKRWVITAGRPVLIEAVAFKALEPLFAGLQAAEETPTDPVALVLNDPGRIRRTIAELRFPQSFHESQVVGRPPHPVPLPLGGGEGARRAGEGAQGLKARPRSEDSLPAAWLGQEMELAHQSLHGPAVVIDYELQGTTNQFTFQSDTTYLARVRREA